MKDLFKAFSDAVVGTGSDDALALYDAVFFGYEGEQPSFYYYSFEELMENLEYVDGTTYLFEDHPIETVAVHFGDENGFSSMVWIVVRHNDSYIKIRGWHSSWDGTEWETVTRVEPFEKIVTDFREVSE